MEADGSHVVIRAADGSSLVRRTADLPAAHNMGDGRWLVPATREAARGLREIVAELGALELDPASTLWLEQAPRWIAHASIETADEPEITISTRWGDPPERLTTLDGLTQRSGRHHAPLSVENARALAELLTEEKELTTTPEIDATIAWLEARPEASSIPGAELDLVDEAAGPTLVVTAIWDEGAADVFHQHQTALAGPDGGDPPASAWPPDVLARFIRLHPVSMTPAASRFVEPTIAADVDSQRLLDLSHAGDADLVVPKLGGELLPFQRAGVAYALERRRVFLADEQGLGKTIEALATLEADGAFPAIVVTPASLKLNWLREIKTWLPERRAVSISGRSPASLGDAEIVVCNYEIVGAQLEVLAELRARALILDESHYVKNPWAARTRAVLELADRLGPDALRLLLTGTPVVNRPAELVSQLRVLDRLSEYGSPMTFKKRFNTGSSRRRLHQALRSSCYLRRKKEDVLEQLPDKRRAVVTVPLDNEGEYRFAERNFIRWLRDQLDEDGSNRVRPDARAEALVRMTALRKLAAEGKLAAALEWIDDFRQSEERLVVFAHHRDIQEAVCERFPESARISGADSAEEREANVRRFQADDGPGLCVCSLEVGAHGFTLTAAANVAFLELGWTPAKHAQAEDRVHRIGQEQRVTAWYLLAAETIDERIAALLEAKQRVVDSLVDGGEAAGESLAAELISDYVAEPA